MMTVKQVAALTGVSVRALQFYDEIGLFKPTKVTEAGYRLYDEKALEVLQQILFFKELDFSLKEIKAVMDSPQFDRTAAFQKQRELLRMKRDRLNHLLNLLGRLIQGDTEMNFKDFDLSQYYANLKAFKAAHTDKIIERMGSVHNYDEMVEGLKAQESEIAARAVKQYGSTQAFTQAMKENLENYLSNGPQVAPSGVDALMAKTEALTQALTRDLRKDAASPEVQRLVGELVSFVNACNHGMDMGENYWQVMAENYLSSPLYIQATDKKYGKGAANFMGLALQAYLRQR